MFAQQSGKASHRPRRLAMVVVIALWLVGPIVGTPGVADAAPVLLDISPLSGKAAQLTFDLIDGDGGMNTSAMIAAVATDGVLGAASSVGGVSGGPLPAAVTLSDTDFLNTFMQGITLGTFFGFDVSLTVNPAPQAGPPDSFAFFLLNGAGTASLVTTDLLGDAIALADLGGDNAGVLTLAGSITPKAIPAPMTLGLLVLGLSMALWQRSRPARA